MTMPSQPPTIWVPPVRPPRPPRYRRIVVGAILAAVGVLTAVTIAVVDAPGFSNPLHRAHTSFDVTPGLLVADPADVPPDLWHWGPSSESGSQIWVTDETPVVCYARDGNGSRVSEGPTPGSGKEIRDGDETYVLIREVGPAWGLELFCFQLAPEPSSTSVMIVAAPSTAALVGYWVPIGGGIALVLVGLILSIGGARARARAARGVGVAAGTPG
ncbi:MAG: hypothetical protein LBG11_00360, partial [Bifidobacteriaceae bacterium]|nr:hypothetical protein [Bifidobacteriaceae bacterium]